MKTQDGLLSFNNSLSTSFDRAVSLAFAESNTYNPNLIGVLFQITINLSTSSTSFISIHDITTYKTRKNYILHAFHFSLDKQQFDRSMPVLLPTTDIYIQKSLFVCLMITNLMIYLKK